MTDFLKIIGDRNTQNMSKKKVHTSKTVPTLRFGNRKVRWIVNKSITAMASCKAHPKVSLLRYKRKQTASARPIVSAMESATEWSSANPKKFAILFGKLHAFCWRMAGNQAAMIGSSNMVV